MTLITVLAEMSVSLTLTVNVALESTSAESLTVTTPAAETVTPVRSIDHSSSPTPPSGEIVNSAAKSSSLPLAISYDSLANSRPVMTGSMIAISA